jgi:hypothetical protein
VPCEYKPATGLGMVEIDDTNVAIWKGEAKRTNQQGNQTDDRVPDVERELSFHDPREYYRRSFNYPSLNEHICKLSN